MLNSICENNTKEILIKNQTVGRTVGTKKLAYLVFPFITVYYSKTLAKHTVMDVSCIFCWIMYLTLQLTWNPVWHTPGDFLESWPLSWASREPVVYQCLQTLCSRTRDLNQNKDNNLSIINHRVCKINEKKTLLLPSLRVLSSVPSVSHV